MIVKYSKRSVTLMRIWIPLMLKFQVFYVDPSYVVCMTKKNETQKTSKIKSRPSNLNSPIRPFMEQLLPLEIENINSI